MRPTKESKDERFCRLAEARVNKILHLFRLLGNLSWTANYAYSKEQVEQIFTTLQLELVKTKLRFLQSQKRIKKRFSLSEPYEVEDPVINEDILLTAYQNHEHLYMGSTHITRGSAKVQWYFRKTRPGHSEGGEMKFLWTCSPQASTGYIIISLFLNNTH